MGLLGEGEARLAAELAGFFVHDSIHGRYKKNWAKFCTRQLSSLLGLAVAPLPSLFAPGISPARSQGQGECDRSSLLLPLSRMILMEEHV